MPDQHPKLSSKALVLDASTIGRAHTILAYTAFGVALLVGSLCHYKKIVKNSVAGYPQEWFPSVSATIGDWYPERNVFQILIALTAGPRFALVACQYYLNLRRSIASSTFSSFLFLAGLIRTFSCGGWVYITSNDDHDMHDIFMITYMVCNLPWMLGGIKCSSATSTTRHKRILVSSAFFVSIVPLVYFFIQHKVHRTPGAYTHYAFFEWGLIFFDILYDSISEQEFREAGLQISLLSSIRSPPKFHGPVPENSPIAGLEEKNSTVNPTMNEVHRGRHAHIPMAGQRTLIIYMSDLYQSYVFWSVLTALIPTLFYFSVWELGIAGHELAILSVLSPVLLGFRSVRDLLAKRSMQASLNLAVLFGLATAFYVERPLRRLGVIAPTAMIAVLKEAALWAGLTDTGDREAKVAYHSILLGLGLLLSSISKQLNHSNNPLWPFVNKETFFVNQLSIVFGLFSVYEIFSRPTGTKTLSAPPTTGRADDALHIHWVTAAVPLGSLLFTLQNLLADPSTLIAWSWTGYERGLPRGPVPHLHGPLTVIAQCVGLLIPIMLHDVSKGSSNALPNIKGPALLSRHWLAVGSTSAYIMYSYQNWAGYAGGLGFAVFLMSISPYILQRAAFAAGGGKLARTYFMAFLIYCVLNVASIFTVAYAFVPGGVYFRERTDFVLFLQVACLALAFRGPQRLPRISTLNYGISKHIKSFCKSTLAILSVISLLATLYRWPTPARPFKPASRIINTGIWTLHFGFDNVGRDSQRGVANLIRDLELDVVGFLETDLHRTCFGHRDLTRVAVEELGYNVDIGPGPNSHTWGAVLLSKFPIINSTHHLLPSPRGELAPAIEAVLDIYGTAVTVVVAHNGQEEDPQDRELQSKELGRIMSASYPRPVIFLGYVVTKPGAARPAPYQILIEDGRMHDIDDEDLDRWCEYIFYRGLYRTSYARVSRGIITDTELQVGQFVLPRPDVGVLNETRPARYIRAFKEEMREEHWFPMAYYGDDRVGGVNGHYYHVFYTPLYYKIPEGAVL